MFSDRHLGKLKITRRTGLFDPWHQIFSKHQERWVKVIFSRDDYIIGWPKYYSEHGDNKQLFLMDATWCRKKDDGNFDELDFEEGVLITNFDKIIGIEIFNRNR